MLKYLPDIRQMPAPINYPFPKKFWGVDFDEHKDFPTRYPKLGSKATLTFSGTEGSLVVEMVVAQIICADRGLVIMDFADSINTLKSAELRDFAKVAVMLTQTKYDADVIRAFERLEGKVVVDVMTDLVQGEDDFAELGEDFAEFAEFLGVSESESTLSEEVQYLVKNYKSMKLQNVVFEVSEASKDSLDKSSKEHNVWTIFKKDVYTDEAAQTLEGIYDFLNVMQRTVGEQTMKELFSAWNNYSSETFQILRALVNGSFKRDEALPESRYFR